jgi:hypothetical protein
MLVGKNDSLNEYTIYIIPSISSDWLLAPLLGRGVGVRIYIRLIYAKSHQKMPHKTGKHKYMHRTVNFGCQK